MYLISEKYAGNPLLELMLLAGSIRDEPGFIVLLSTWLGKDPSSSHKKES